jgi:predicted patatin/cPLA2 family phospholipase
MKKNWFNIPTWDLISNWPFLGPLEMFWRSGVFDNQGLRDLISNTIGDKKYQRGIIWHSTDISKGDVVVFDETVDEETRIDAIISTASIPVIFPNVNLHGHTLIDGFVYENLGMTEAITKCREFGFDDKDIILDIILCSGKKMEISTFTKRETEYLNAYNMISRKSDFQYYYATYEDVLRVIRGYPEIQIRHMIAP